MKNLKRPLVLVSTLIVVCLLVSWNLFDDSHTPTTFGITASNEISSQTIRRPAAEDVLVQRIPGDKGHLLLMAYYSKENYSQPSFTIENGFSITLRDDGKGDDKVAGDGLYSAKIPADLAGFRIQAMNLLQKMKAGKFEPVTYLNRQRIMDPDAAESFDIAKFEANEPVSTSGLTNVLSTDAKPTGPGTAALPTLDAIKQKSIFITHLSVVEDATRTWNFITQTGNSKGVWSFNTLIRNLASKNKAQVATDKEVSDFVLNWFNQYATDQTVNGDFVPKRPLTNDVVLATWLQQSQAAGAPAGQLDMKFAPFKLTAITNRFDLRDGEKFGNSGEYAGEARFIFTLIASKDFTGTNTHKGDALRFNVILEARPNVKNKCDDKRAWAQQWVNLANLSLPSTAYNDALQKITDQYSSVGNTPSAPNQNSLSQLRTNEAVLEAVDPPNGVWELREFHLVNNGNPNSNGKGNVKLTISPDGQAPTDKSNGLSPTTLRNDQDVKRMADFVNQNTNAINGGFFTVSTSFGGAPFLGGVSRVNGAPVNFGGGSYHWDGTSTSPITNDEARFNFSLQTCSGCHSGEAQTFFTHVNNVRFGAQAGLSGFVSGEGGQLGFVQDADGKSDGVFSVKDPAGRPSGNPTMRSFNEIDRRGKDLLNFVSTSCGSVLAISSELLFAPTTSAD